MERHEATFVQGVGLGITGTSFGLFASGSPLAVYAIVLGIFTGGVGMFLERSLSNYDSTSGVDDE